MDFVALLHSVMSVRVVVGVRARVWNLTGSSALHVAIFQLSAAVKNFFWVAHDQMSARTAALGTAEKEGVSFLIRNPQSRVVTMTTADAKKKRAEVGGNKVEWGLHYVHNFFYIPQLYNWENR